MNLNEAKAGVVVHLAGSNHRRGKVMGAGSQDDMGRDIIIVEWDDRQIQKVTLRSLMTEAEYQASIAPPPPPVVTRGPAIATAVPSPFESGQRISTKPEMVPGDGAYNRAGTVIGPVPKSPGMVMVEWDYPQGEITKVSASTLITEEEAEATKLKLEDDFDSLQKQLHDKLQQAAELISEAAEQARKHGHDLSEMYDTIDPLMDALDNAGWCSSSLGC